MWHVQGRREVHTWFGLGKLKEKGDLEDIGIDGNII
jgi:hypothetical protein